MRARLTSIFAVLGAVTVLVLAANTVALAASGRGFLLGQTNQTAKLTTLDRITTGPALRLQTKNDGAAPFSTNARGKVKNLDSDTIDGLDSTTLRDATTLQGRSPENFQSQGQLVSLYGSGTGQTDFTAGLGVALQAVSTVTYTVTLGQASGDSSCTLEYTQVYNEPVSDWTPLLTTSSSADSPTFSESAVVATGPHTVYRLHCTSGTPFFSRGSAVVTFIKH